MNYDNIEFTKGFKSLNIDELKVVNGGSIVFGLFVAAAFYLLSEYDSIKKGWNDAAAGNDYNYDPCPCSK